MKLERISENKIRCTLTRDDLTRNHLRLSELAYGTEKSRKFFNQVMQLAEKKLGFEVESGAYMIEAVPDRKEQLILIITKVENPEELDNRFSQFTHSEDGFKSMEEDPEEDRNGEEMLSMGQDARGSGNVSDSPDIFPEADAEDPEQVTETKGKKSGTDSQTYLYVFRSLNHIIQVVKSCELDAVGDSALYKNPVDKRYYLYFTLKGDDNMSKVRLGISLQEYGKECVTTPATEAFFEEHYTPILKEKAMETLQAL